MRPPILSCWLLTILLILGNLPAAQASHIRGGDISYTSVASTTAGVPRYHVVVRMFSEAMSVPPISSMPLRVSRAGCATAAPNSSTVQVPLIQSATSLPVTCANGSSLYYVARYETDLDLPSGQWLLDVVNYARSAAIANINNAASTDLYISAFLDNTLTTQDASPKFESVLQPYLVLGTVPPHSFSAFDTDGDSLRYEAMLPLMACSTPANSTYAPHYQVNTSSGAITQLANSTTQGVYDIVVRVSEYRRINGAWQLLGSIMRDNLYLVYSTANQAPTFTTLQVNGGASQSLSQLIKASPGQTIALTLTATDPDASQLLRFATEAINVVPGLTLTTLNATQVKLTWQVPATLPLGRYHIPVAVLDNGCPYSASEERTLSFLIVNQVLASRSAAPVVAPAYPTPFREQVQFAAPAGQAVIIVDALGRVVAQLASSADGQVRWQPAATLPAGVYLARGTEGQPLARLLRE